MGSMGPGTRGEDVRDVQARLASLGFATEPDDPGTFGGATEAAVRRFQRKRNLPVDGTVGDDTWHEIVEAGYSLGDRALYLRYPSMRGDDVRLLQNALNRLGFDAGREDGIFGERTERAIRDFQRNAGLVSDGIVGPTTLSALGRLRSGAGSGGPGFGAVREDVALHGPRRASIAGAVIALDPAHGGSDPGGVGPSGMPESEATLLLAEALATELRARGAATLLLRGSRGDPSTSERARAANERSAEAFVSIHLEAHAEPSPPGAAVYYCGREDWYSRAGRHLAESVEDRLRGLGLPSGGIHAMWLPILRETRMPAVLVTPARLGEPGTEALLRDSAFLRRLAIALAAGVERFFTSRPRPEAEADAPVP
jgi:N-acetylmuramoyl-L-alanine amidase